jgi:general secretion pathway protein A
MTGLLDHHQPQEGSYVESFETRFIYRSEAQAQALGTIVDRVHHGDSLVILSGEQGVGKTTLCLELFENLRSGAGVSVLLNPRLKAGDVSRQLIAGFGMVASGRSQHTADLLRGQPALCGLLANLTEGQRHVVLIDDAHDLDPDLLAELLTAAEVNEDLRGLQIVLAGTQDLEDLLERIGPVRVAHHERLSPLSEREVRDYVERRLWVAFGGSSRPNVRRPRFSNAAIDLIVSASRGNLRLVNAVCDHALRRASERSSTRIDSRLVRRAASELGLPVGRPLAKTAAALGAILAVGLLALPFVRQQDDPSDASVPRASDPVVLGASSGPVEAFREVEPASIASAQRLDADQLFQAFRGAALERATRLASAPDVRGLLKLQDEVILWERETGYANHEAVKDLLLEFERLTNDARERQLAIDRELLLEHLKQP